MSINVLFINDFMIRVKYEQQDKTQLGKGEIYLIY